METRGSRSPIWWMLLGVAIFTLATALRAITGSLPDGTVPDALRDMFTLSIGVFIESLPFVFLGILLSIVVQVWLPPTLVDRLLPRTPLLRRMAMSLLGVVMPVCECGNVPLARGLIQRGLSVPEVLTFLLAAPILNPITVITTYQAFGWSNGILVGRVLGGFVIANLVGWFFSRHPHPEQLLTTQFEASCRVDHAGRARQGRMRRSVLAFAEESSTMLPALAVGSLLAGVIQTAVPRQALVSLGANPVWSVVALMALAFIVAICSNVDAFFILSFGSTFMPGGIVAFLTFGAMVDVKMLTLLRTTFTGRTLARLTALVALGTLILGFGVNLLV